GTAKRCGLRKVRPSPVPGRCQQPSWQHPGVSPLVLQVGPPSTRNDVCDRGPYRQQTARAFLVLPSWRACSASRPLLEKPCPVASIESNRLGQCGNGSLRKTAINNAVRDGPRYTRCARRPGRAHPPDRGTVLRAQAGGCDAENAAPILA